MALMIIHYMWHLIRYLSYVILHKAALTYRNSAEDFKKNNYTTSRTIKRFQENTGRAKNNSY